MEEAVIATLQSVGISNPYAKADAPGIYIDNKKVSSLGLKVTKNGTYHGIAINLDMDLTPFLGINPCGYAGLEMCNVSHYLSSQQLDANHPLKKQFDVTAKVMHYQQLRNYVTAYFLSHMAKSLGYTNLLSYDAIDDLNK